MSDNAIPLCDDNGKIRNLHLPDHLKVENLDDIDPVALFEQAMEG